MKNPFLAPKKMKIIQIKRKNLDTLKEFLFIAHV